jgi:hypothetical protein
MDDDTHLALAILAICDSLEPLLGFEHQKARKHAHAIINRNHKPTTEMEPDVCRCPEDQRPDCDCYGTCICTAP